MSNIDEQTQQDSSHSAAVEYSTLLGSRQQLDAMVHQWIVDDVPSGVDVGGFVVGDQAKTAVLYMKSSGMLAGKPFFEAVFRTLNCAVQWSSDDDTTASSSSLGAAEEGRMYSVEGGTKVEMARVRGSVHNLLRGERTALNILSRCSGVATASRKAVDAARSLHWNGYVAGTRKTTPGFRLVEKYGLLVGGAATHRLDLSQMVMLKDNHIWATGSITEAVSKARRAAGFSQKIEVECQSLDEAIEAASAGADIVMLDNFEPAALKRDAATLKSQFPHVLIEASGGITLDTMKEYLSEHVDIVSQGSLTQGYSCIDFSLKIVH
jgi:nicotinate-nucleotide pyrophosphorylase (carboxylating)